MDCPQCKRPLRTRDADGRELRICDSCGYRTYGIRHAGGGGREAVLDQISDEVVVDRFSSETARPNQSMEPMAPLRSKFSVFATAPCRGLSLPR